jgi:hypothetical protein
MAKRQAATGTGNELFDVLKSQRNRFDPDEIVSLFASVSAKRVEDLASGLADYIGKNLPAAFEKRDGLADYRTNPYVLMTSASVMNLDEPEKFADFLFNSKLYMSLETSFGKSVESTLVGPYPLNQKEKWTEAPEKITESAKLSKLSRQEKAQQRTGSVWREIDKSCVSGERRYLTGIKSGPNTINDTQVQAMTDALRSHHRTWMEQTHGTYPKVRELDIVIGLTYGTDRTTNNKENQILAKLLDHGFKEEDRKNRPGVLIDAASQSIRVYRRIGKDFWAFIGNPNNPSSTPFVFLEVLLSLAKALASVVASGPLEDRVNRKIQQLAVALSRLKFPRGSLPDWVRKDFKDSELFWFATAISAFFDEGI